MVGLIVVAAGYGSLRNDADGTSVPKVIEPVDGLPMIAYSLRLAERAGITTTVVVVNPRDRAPVIAAIRNSVHVGTVSRMPEIVTQPERRGSADAVLRAIPHLLVRDVQCALVTYGDMPNWSTRSARALCARHRSDYLVTMATVLRCPEHPVLDRYGRVLRDHCGAISEIMEYNDPCITSEILAIERVNPSFWIWNLGWLANNIPKITPFKKTDGYGDELHMPPLIKLMTMAGFGAHECAFAACASEEALGVNTLNELQSLKKRRVRH